LREDGGGERNLFEESQQGCEVGASGLLVGVGKSSLSLSHITPHHITIIKSQVKIPFQLHRDWQFLSFFLRLFRSLVSTRSVHPAR
jgi:hypothetical protein